MVIEAGFDRVKLKSAVRLRSNISLSAKIFRRRSAPDKLAFGTVAAGIRSRSY
jgi:hypothetical protein